MKFKKVLLMSLLVATAMFTGCGSTETEGTGSSQTESSQETSEDKRSQIEKDTQEETTDAKEETEADKEATDAKEETGAAKEAVNIEALAEECIYNVYWYTQDDAYSAGTSFLMDSDVHGEPLLVSAFHYLEPEEGITGSALPEYVTGGEIYNAYTDDFTYATLKNCVIIEDAASIPSINKDVTAFTIQDGEDLKTLSLAQTPAKEGDKVYLLADLWDTEEIHENCVYEGEVAVVEDGVIYYTIEGQPGTSGASGAPIVNELGEVVAIHIGSNPMYYAGHTADSFLEQINNGKISEVTYEAYEEIEPTEYLYFERDEKVSSMFYDVQIDAVTVSESLDGQSLEGYQFVVLDISLWAGKRETEPVPMYYSDFALEWTDEYCEPLEQGWTETQLPDEYYITQEKTSGQLVFLTPVEEKELIFSFIDMYYTDDPNETSVDKYYGIELPAENWTR